MNKIIIFLLINCFSSQLYAQTSLIDSSKVKNLADQVAKVEFSNLNSYKEVPKFIRKKIRKIMGRKFKPADATEKYDAGDAHLKKMPKNRIVYIGLSGGIALITYEQGGIGVSIHSLIIQFNDKEVSCIWSLSVPQHYDVNEFKNLLTNGKSIELNSEKSRCW